METFLQQIINGLVLGSMYALVALGYTMVYGIINLINFAHGEVLMVGALTSWTVVTLLADSGLPGWLVMLISLVCAIVVCAALTVIVGEPDATSRVSGPPLPGFTIQFVTGAVTSLNCRFPIVWAPSSVTVVFAARFRVLKNAVLFAPPATVPPDQLAVAGQLPPARLVQVPLAACATDALRPAIKVRTWIVCLIFKIILG